MSFFTSSTSIKKYLVFGAPKGLSLAKLQAAMSAKAIGPVRHGSKSELRMGWTYSDFADSEGFLRATSFDLSHCCFASKLVFALRLEERKVPAKLASELLKDRLAKALLDAQESGKAPKRRKQLQTEIKVELLERVLPQISSVEIVWDLDTHNIWLSKTSTKLSECFEKLFHSCFSDSLGLQLCPALLPTLDHDRPQKAQAYLDQIYKINQQMPSITN